MLVNDDDDEVRLYVEDVFPIFTIVFSLLYLDERVVDDESRMGAFFAGGISHVTNMAISASTEPNKNGGPGSKCFN